MKILYVTRDLPDGDLVEHELVRLLPQARVLVSTSVADALARVPTLTSSDVLLLDHASLDQDLADLVRQVNGSGGSPVVIALTSPAEPVAGDTLAAAGVCESFVKSGGYLERLARSIGRLPHTQEKAASGPGDERLRLIVEQMPTCVVMLTPDGTVAALNWAGMPFIGAHKLEQVVGKPFASLLPEDSKEPFLTFVHAVCGGRPGSFPLNWTGLDGVARRQELRGVPFRRDAAGTTVLLGVIGDVDCAAPDTLGTEPAEVRPGREVDERLWAAEQRSADLERELRAQQGVEARIIEKIRVLRGEWDTARQDLEKRLKEAEDQRAVLQASLEKVRAGDGEQARDRERWERLLQDLEARVASAEGQCASLDLALQAARQTGEQASSQAERERGQWQAAINEAAQRMLQLEQERAALQAGLEAERAAWVESRRKLEAEALAAGSERSDDDSALADAVALKEMLAARLEAEREEWAEARGRLEAELRTAGEARSAAENALAEALAAHQQLANRVDQERSEWNESRLEIELRLKVAADAREALEAALEDEQSARRAVVSQVEWERAQWTTARQKLEQKLAETMSSAESADAANVLTRRELEERASRLEEQVTGLTAILSVAEESGPGASLREELREEARREYEARLREASTALAEKSALAVKLESEAEGLRAALAAAESARRSADEELREASLILEQLQLEKAQRDSSQNDVEQRRLLAEAERAGLEEALRAAQQVQTRFVDELRAERARASAERAERRQEQESLERLRATNQELAAALEQLRSTHAELIELRRAERTRLDRLSAEAEQLRTDREEMRRRLLQTGMRYRQLIQEKSESFHQALNGTVSRLQQISQSRIALLTAQHREELERLQQLVREGTLRQQDLDALLRDGEQADRKIAESGESAG